MGIVAPVENYSAYKRDSVLRRARGFVYLSSCFFLLSSCEGDYDPSSPLNPNHRDIVDPRAGLTREDYRALNEVESYYKTPDGKSGNIMEPPIPDIAEILTMPRPPKIGETKMVSVAVTDDVPLKDVLIELARLADVDIEVDAGVTGGVSFRAKDRPFNEVIARLADLGGLRYNMKNNVLRVERDTPYIHTYRLDLLNVDRSFTGNIGVSSNGNAGSGGGAAAGGAGGGATGGGGGTTGSHSTINAESKSDFWVKFEEGITKILAYQPTIMVSATTIASQPTLQQPVPDLDNPNPLAPPPAPVPVPVPVVAVPATAAGSTTPAGGAFYSLNRQAGTLTVSATERQHETIRQFLNEIESNTSSQVLIEAKIVEVSLSDRYQTGINWTNFGENGANFSGDLDSVASQVTNRTSPSITLLKNGILGTNLDLSAAVKLLDEFGTARALSSPRLNAMNNQQAVLSFVENLLYFDIDIQVTDAVPGTGSSPTTPAKVQVTSTPLTVPVGIVLALQPSINKDTNEITLSVRPTLSKATQFVVDPGFEVGKAQAAAALDEDSPIVTTLQAIESKIPQLEVRELDSIMKVKSGQVMVIGGLLEDKVATNDAGIPGVAEIPYFGNLFKSVDKTTTKKELVIMIRATIVSPHGSVDKADKGVYQKFIKDPRPLEF
jgi:MSHA type pilus biogenesis protein MshL